MRNDDRHQLRHRAARGGREQAAEPHGRDRRADLRPARPAR